MRKIVLTLVLFLSIFGALHAEKNVSGDKFVDDNFKAYILANFDKNKDGKISEEEALAVENIDCSDMRILSLDGIEIFSNLKSLICSDNRIKSLDLSYNVKLEYLDCWSNSVLEFLNVNNCTKLEKLFIGYNNIRTIALYSCVSLKEFNAMGNSMDVLDMSENKELTFLDIRDSRVQRLNIDNCSKIREIHVDDSIFTDSIITDKTERLLTQRN